MKTILVVDDEFDLVNTLRAILQGEGYRVESCTDGREALDRLEGEGSRPDLVLMDVMMPRVSGLEVLRVIRETPKLSDIPVILMSVITPDVRRADYAWQAFLRKPFTLQALIKAVHQLSPDPAGTAEG